MAEAFIVGAVRTPIGKRGGGLSAVHPADLGAHALRGLIVRTGVDPARIDDVLWGCVGQVGPQASNVGRITALSAGLPESVPGTTLDRQCGSSQQALHFAAQAVMSGTQDLVVAGGVEVMSQVPIASPTTIGLGAGMAHPRSGNGWAERYGDQEISQFRGAELIAAKWGLTREAMEAYAVESHRRAIEAIEQGLFDDEILPYGDVTRDEGPRPGTTPETLATLQPLREDGRLTAALASQISDGAAALLVASERAVREQGLTPLARVHTMTVVGSDPVYMLTGPIPATERLLARAGVALSDIGAFEVNEAFASVPMAWLQETGADPARTNPQGGAIALGHPLGGTGARLLTTLVHRMRRENLRYGMQTMCEGGGMANATLLELV
ncbi:acetyl-CoA C-acetyltransferase [Planosporangium thailandense]|uniref:Acetyl-CoA C-acetyltransferase n=1 Tax=Planosporangium thailandense TaxID=765197 RepID=A0ABX0Y0L0_9ACTN|nr:acetyl-CoA C-acetyltransferase [Planosporangium thailandense]NJC71886.1 acetyl-CoA C-acetyltransferase [Planosporangium thailandense]